MVPEGTSAVKCGSRVAASAWVPITSSLPWAPAGPAPAARTPRTRSVLARAPAARRVAEMRCGLMVVSPGAGEPRSEWNGSGAAQEREGGRRVDLGHPDQILHQDVLVEASDPVRPGTVDHGRDAAHPEEPAVGPPGGDGQGGRG